jgi:SapC
MASAPQASMPLFYNDLVPLNAREHGLWHARAAQNATWMIGQHAVPLTVEEFPQASRHYPIIFAAGENPVPLALMGLNEGINVFVDSAGAVAPGTYVPAYARRYPFLLAKLTPETTELSLCFDPTSELLGPFSDGEPLFAGSDPTEATRNVLGFCEQFEQAGQRTQNFVEELTKHDLLMDGEASIQQAGAPQPFIYRGFQMINQEKLRDMRGDILRGWAQSGLLPLIYAHVFSLDLMSTIFGKQAEQGVGPLAAPAVQIPAL